MQSNVHLCMHMQVEAGADYNHLGQGEAHLHVQSNVHLYMHMQVEAGAE